MMSKHYMLFIIAPFASMAGQEIVFYGRSRSISSRKPGLQQVQGESKCLHPPERCESPVRSPQAVDARDLRSIYRVQAHALSQIFAFPPVLCVAHDIQHHVVCSAQKFLLPIHAQSTGNALSSKPKTERRIN